MPPILDWKPLCISNQLNWGVGVRQSADICCWHCWLAGWVEHRTVRLFRFQVRNAN